MYATEEEFEQAFGEAELSDLLSDGADYAKTEAAVASLINGYVGSRYPLPLVAVPDMLKGWALDIVRFRLWDEQAPQQVRERYEDAIAQLRDLAAGKIALPPDASGTPAESPIVFDGYSNERVFTECSLKDF